MSSVIYYALNLAFPVPGKAKSFREVDVSGVADDARSGMADDGASERRKGDGASQTGSDDKKSQAEANVYEAA